MIPAWKAKRELARILLKISDFLIYPLERLTQIRYDRNFANNVQLTSGGALPSQKIAIFFIYQPAEFSKSIFFSCKYLVGIGYSIILVSSTPLIEKDKAALTGLCWKIIERPNYGYDFGGYRDGIRVLFDSAVDPETLIIMNDSIWFPISHENQMIEKLEVADRDFGSPVFENKPGRNKRNQHFQSYFTFLKPQAIRSAAFLNYWRNYKVSSKKRIVLLRGEKGFSQAMLKAGFGGDTQSTRSTLFGHLQNQTNDFLLKTLEYAAYDDARLASVAHALLKWSSDSDVWRKDALLHMKQALDKTQPMGVFCYACIKLLDFSFIKKSSYPVVYDGMRWQYLRAVKNGDLPAPHPDILAEIVASKMDGRFTTDPSIPALLSATKMA